MADTTSEETSEDTGSPASAGAKNADPGSSFGDDDLGRIQGILFGDHARKTDERLNVMEIALLGAIADLREETAKKIEALETRVEAEAETRERAVGNLGDRVDRDVTEQASRVDDLRSEVESVEQSFTKSIDGVESSISAAVSQLKQETKKSIDDTRADIGASKVDRSALSNLLRELGEQIDQSATAQEDNLPKERG